MGNRSTKRGLIGSLYVLGLALVVIGCFLPLTTHFGGNANGATAFSRISKGGILSVGATLALVGAAAGIVVDILRFPKTHLCKFCALLVSIAGGLYVLLSINENQSKAIKIIANITSSHFGLGFYVIVVGWALAVLGLLLHRD